MAALCTAFQNRKPRKKYRAVLCGEPSRDSAAAAAATSGGEGGEADAVGGGARGVSGGVIYTPLDGRPSITRWSAVKCTPSDRYGRLTLVDMWWGCTSGSS
jgi:23S rRNA-/tRNA-specific pseudouridylate synthase